MEPKAVPLRHKALIASTILILSVLASGLMYNLLVNQPSPKSQVHYELEVAFQNLIFNHPVGIYSPQDGTNRLFVVGQMGVIYVFENRRNISEASIFLNVSDRVHLGAFLGLAFDPNFASNGRFYVNYLANNPLRTVIAQWSVNPNDSDKADVNSQKTLMEVPQLYESHAGGQLGFGPNGYLYIALGDGNPYGDLSGNAQNLSALQGKILRIDVNNPSKNSNYSIPSDNPFTGTSIDYKEEIYAYGFRNPWRFSFDLVTGKLWVGDVGQDRMEEIDVVERGKNYGWNIMEGTLPFLGGNESGLELPIWEYGRDQGNATIGGFVYHGTKLAELINSYVYGDYVSGRIWSLNVQDSGKIVNKELLQTNLNITSFGIDSQNELLICAQDGRVYKLVDSSYR
jgi:glucose/arabinose dehydrogenase